MIPPDEELAAQAHLQAAQEQANLGTTQTYLEQAQAVAEAQVQDAVPLQDKVEQNKAKLLDLDHGAGLGRPTKYVQPLPEYTRAKAIDMISNGMNTNEASKIIGTSRLTIQRWVDKYSGFEGAYSLIKSVGVMAGEVSLRCLGEIIRRYEEEPETMKKMNAASLMVMAGIATDKMNTCLSKPTMGQEPNWADVTARLEDKPKVVQDVAERTSK